MSIWAAQTSVDIATATWLLQNCAGADYAGNMFLPRELLIFSQENQWRKGEEEELIHFWIFLFPKMMSFQLTSVTNAPLE